jgi:hypothetical protein
VIDDVLALFDGDGPPDSDPRFVGFHDHHDVEVNEPAEPLVSRTVGAVLFSADNGLDGDLPTFTIADIYAEQMKQGVAADIPCSPEDRAALVETFKSFVKTAESMVEDIVAATFIPGATPEELDARFSPFAAERPVIENPLEDMPIGLAEDLPPRAEDEDAQRVIDHVGQFDLLRKLDIFWEDMGRHYLAGFTKGDAALLTAFYLQRRRALGATDDP